MSLSIISIYTILEIHQYLRLSSKLDHYKVPSKSEASVDAASAVLQMKNFILNGRPIKGVVIRSLIDEGRE